MFKNAAVDRMLPSPAVLITMTGSTLSRARY